VDSDGRLLTCSTPANDAATAIGQSLANRAKAYLSDNDQVHGRVVFGWKKKQI